MIVRDMYCTGCGEVAKDCWLESLVEMSLSRTCDECRQFTVHKPVCNGGIKSRWRYIDWPSDPDFYRGQVKAMDVTAHDSHGDEVLKYDSSSKSAGDAMHADSKYRNGGDKREERRDKIQHDTARKRGTTPLVFDAGKK